MRMCTKLSPRLPCDEPKMSGWCFVGAYERNGEGRRPDGAALVVDPRRRRRLEETVAAIIERYRREIVDYAVLDRELLENDVAGVSRDNLVCLLDYLERGDRITEDELRAFRAGAARRVHQGVSLDSLLHAYRLWGQTVWDTVLACADRGEPDEREAALAVAGVLISHLNLVSTTIAKAYLDETEGVWSQQEVVGRALLESLISGAGASAEVVEGARRAGVELG